MFRIQKIENDEHFGDCKPVGNGIRELKIDYAKGYRVYFKESFYTASLLKKQQRIRIPNEMNRIDKYCRNNRRWE